MIFDRFGELQMPTRDFTEKKREKKRKKKKRKKETRKRARIGAYVRVHDRPNANMCTFHSFPQNVAKKRMYVIFFCAFYAVGETGKKWKRKDGDKTVI